MSTTNPETRNRILAAARELLERNKGKNVRMSDIAKAAKLSRQAVYLHFESRINLMVATVQYGDELLGATKQVQPWREAEGVAKLDALIKFWGNYVPQIYGIAKALMMAKDSDEAAAAAWADRMSDVRKHCRETIDSLAKAKLLSPTWKLEPATDMLSTMLSIPAWEQLTVTCGWSTKQYIDRVQNQAHRTFLNS